MRRNTPIGQSFDLGDDFPDDTFNQRGYKNEKGLPMLCRLEFRMNTIQEIKQCAVEISELNARLQFFAYEDTREDLARIFHARSVMAEFRQRLKYLRARQYKDAEKTKKHGGYVLGGVHKYKPNSVPVSTTVGKLNRPIFKASQPSDFHQPIDNKGEKP
jgi:hypothetical protein